MSNDWIKATIQSGDQIGRTISYPTINLHPNVIPPETKPGVYAALVELSEEASPTPTIKPGALFFGPRLVLNETHNVLEIYVLNWENKEYNQNISFKIIEWIRPPMAFDSLEEMRKQIALDVEAVESVYRNYNETYPDFQQ